VNCQLLIANRNIQSLKIIEPTKALRSGWLDNWLWSAYPCRLQFTTASSSFSFTPPLFKKFSTLPRKFSEGGVIRESCLGEVFRWQLPRGSTFQSPPPRLETPLIPSNPLIFLQATHCVANSMRWSAPSFHRSPGKRWCSYLGSRTSSKPDCCGSFGSQSFRKCTACVFFLHHGR